MTIALDGLEAELLEEPSDGALVLVRSASVELATELAEGHARARSFATEARAANTRRAYEGEWSSFVAWCSTRRLTPLPAEGQTVAIYLADLAERPRATAGIALALTAISQVHLVAGQPSPRTSAAVRETWKGIRRVLGVAQKGKAPLVIDALAAAAAALPSTLTGVRDRALLLLCFWGAFRREEIVELDVENVRERPRGLEVLLIRSKTDQEGAGRTVPVPYAADESTCAVRALRAWLVASKISAGPLFRSINRWGKLGSTHLQASHVARVAKAAAAAAGLAIADVSGHSFRAGFVTSAAEAGATIEQIMKTTGHRRGDTVRRYIRRAELFEGLAGPLIRVGGSRR